MPNRSRMIEWLASAFALYFACIALRTLGIEPQVQVVLWKLANVTVAAYIGYWIDRRAFARIRGMAGETEQLRRAIVMAAAMVSVALGL